jgi:hypothetical protein
MAKKQKYIPEKKIKLDPKELLLRLFDSYASGISTNLWPWEKQRWYELVFCILTVFGEPQVLAVRTRQVTEILSEMGLIDVNILAGARPIPGPRAAPNPILVTIETMLCQAGFAPEKAKTAVIAICEVANNVKKKYNGRIQGYLQKYGNHMLDNIDDDFGLDGFKDARRAVSIWLQNILNMPVPASDVLTEQACKKLGVSYKAMVQAANQQDINVALVDDALRAYWESKSLQEESLAARKM